MKYFIITGASKGLGKAFAEKLLHATHVLLLISRNPDPTISKKALIKNCQVHNVAFDLSDIERIPELISNLIDHIGAEDCEGIYLINNAGIVEPVRKISKVSAAEVQYIYNVNLLAPVLMSSGLIRHAADIDSEKFILNITSGAATIPHHGMSLYCSTKAGLDIFTKSISVEQQQAKNPVKIHAISPGFVKSEMLDKVMEKDKDDFADIDKFKQAKRDGLFADPENVASNIIDLLLKGKLRHGIISHLNDY